MARKKHAEEHENLERWLVSYADFMTLLFATFVVLYALAQSDVNAFKNIEEALRKAFSQNIFDSQASIMDGENSILDGQAGATNPLMFVVLFVGINGVVEILAGVLISYPISKALEISMKK